MEGNTWEDWGMFPAWTYIPPIEIPPSPSWFYTADVNTRTWMVHCGHASLFRVYPVIILSWQIRRQQRFLLTSLFFHIHPPRQQDTMASQCDTSLCVSGGGEKKKKKSRESRPPSVALELLLWTDEPAAADGRIFWFTDLCFCCSPPLRSNSWQQLI